MDYKDELKQLVEVKHKQVSLTESDISDIIDKLRSQLLNSDFEKDCCRILQTTDKKYGTDLENKFDDIIIRYKHDVLDMLRQIKSYQ